MKGRPRAFAAVFALALAGSSAVVREARATLQGPVPPERSSSAAPASAEPLLAPVRVDAIATDARGRRVLDLRPQDFEVRAHGAVQKVQVELRKNPAARVFAFYLDEFHVSPGAPSARTREAVARFIDRTLRPGDLAVVLKPLEPVSGLTLTADREALKTAVSAFDGRKGDYAPRTRFEELYIGRAPAAVAAARAQIVTVALTELALRLGEMKVDRAAIILISEGFDRAGPSRLRRVGDVQGLARAASRLHLALYPFNPADAVADGAGDAIETLRTLGRQTGGEVVLDPAAIPAALERVAADLDAYYALTFDPQVTDGRYHAIDVRARRPGVHVRARAGYWAPLDSEWRAWLARPASTPAAPRRELRRSLLIEAWVGVVPGADGGADMVLAWEPSPRPTSARLPDAILVHARSEGGAVLADGPLRSSRGRGAGRVLRFPVAPGRIELDLVIPRADGTLLDVERRDVDVPDLKRAKPGPVLLPPAVIRARSAREFAALAADPDAPPTASRTFSRADRLLVRVPAWEAAGVPVELSARLMNVLRQPMRTIDRRAGSGGAGVAEFDLPLSWLAPGEYEIEVAARNANGAAAQHITFRVTR